MADGILMRQWTFESDNFDSNDPSSHNQSNLKRFEPAFQIGKVSLTRTKDAKTPNKKAITDDLLINEFQGKLEHPALANPFFLVLLKFAVFD
jgi:hypothetical protein